MLRRIVVLVCWGLLSCSLSVGAATTRKAEVVFKKWVESQRVYSTQKDLKCMESYSATEKFLSQFKLGYESQLSLFLPATPFLKKITGGMINDHGYRLALCMNQQALQELTLFYMFLEQDMPAFVDLLKKLDFAHPDICSLEQVSDIDEIIEKYNKLFNLFLNQEDQERATELLLTVSRHFFDYCFSDVTYRDFQKLLNQPEFYPIVRMIYSIMWYNCAGSGWKHWSQESLDLIKQRARVGDTIIYIAGGSDIYQLIKSGVFSTGTPVDVINIDPQLPTQPKYYADGWDWIIGTDDTSPVLGDRILFTVNNTKIIMERTSSQQVGIVFKARLHDGQIAEIPQGRVVWTLWDEFKNKLGTYTLERRFVQQSDMSLTDKTTYVISFNELYFLSIPDFLNGWGIKIVDLPEDFSIVVKQLGRAVTKSEIYHMRLAEMINVSGLKFISLGSCIN